MRNLTFIAPIAFVMPAYAADYLTEAQVQKVLFPTASDFLKKSIALTDDQIQKVKDLAGVRQRNKNPLIWDVLQKGKPLGRVFIDEVVGKHEFITYAIGVDAEGKVVGIEIMSYRETHGGEVREESWRKTFRGKTISDPFKLDIDFPNISGATLSCRNVLDGVKRLLSLQQVLTIEKIL